MASRPTTTQALHNGFTEKALENPSAQAISSWDGDWTYAELDLAATRLRKYLARLQVHESKSCTALFCFENSSTGIIALLAILKAGLTCVPISPGINSQRKFDKVVKETDPQLLCVSAAYGNRYTDFNGKTVIVSPDLLLSLEIPDQQSECPSMSKNDVAFIQYTDGVTGSPKGVKQGHSGLHTGILAHCQELGYDNDSRVLHSNPYNTTVGISEVFGTLFHGGCVIIVSEMESPALFTEMINEKDVTHACFTPTESRSLEPMDLWQLRTVTFAGEGFTAEEIEKWGLETELIRTYGTVETCVPVSACKAPSPYLFDPYHIGSPYLKSFWVVEQGNIQRLAPIGSIGELVVGGPTLALGYIESETASSDCFFVNPDWAVPSPRSNDQRFFATGDLVRNLGNDEYVFCGRKEANYDITELDDSNEGFIEEVPPLSLLGSNETTGEIIEAAASACGVSLDMIEDIYPATPMQEGLFALSNKQPGAFMKQDIFELPSDIDIDRFQKAWQSTTQQSATLRTRLFMTDSLRVLQVVVSQPSSCEVFSDLDSYVKRDLEDLMLWGEPLFRYAICRTSNQKAYLVMTMHHALFDGWTLDLIFDRVKQNFDGSPAMMKASFNCFVRYVQDLDPDEMDLFWKTQLDDASATVFPVLPAANYQPIPNETFELDISFQRNGGSSTMQSTLIQAAWALTVAKYADSHDITFGWTVSGRAAPVSGIMEMMGPTVATVPLRLQMQKDTNLGAFLQQVQRQSTTTIAYEQAGMHRIKKLTAGTHRACSFQTALIVQPMEIANGLEVLGCRRVNDMHDSYQPYAMNVEVSLQKDGAVVGVLFDNNVIDKSQVKRVMNTFNQTLREIGIASSDLILDQFVNVTTQDIEEIKSWNQLPPLSAQEAVHQAFEEQASRSPSSPAVASWDGDLTYANLDSLSNRLANHLLNLGVDLEMIVPLHFEKSKWAIVSILAVLKAGGTCLSFDVSHPPDRLCEMVKKSNASIMLVGKAPPSKVADCIDIMIFVGEELFETLDHRDLMQVNAVTPHNRAFIVFTSGSTGSPKGIELEHQAACTSSRAYAAAVDIGPGSRCLQYSSFAFDVHITDIFVALISGACCCIPSEEDRMSNLGQTMNVLGVNHVDITPTVANLLMPEEVPDLRSMVVGGEPVTTETARRWGDSVTLINMYSQSETSNWVTHNVVLSDTQQPSNIGLGGGVCTWIVDQHSESRLAPIGCIGELFVEGPVLARGYLNDSEKTNSSFVSDPPWLPTGTTAGRRMYRTGDLVRYNSNGTLVYVGRRDAQVKLRGQRLELAEVDHKIIEMPQVKACLTVLPKVGLCQGRCVAVLSLHDVVGGGLGVLQIVGTSHRIMISAELAAIRDHLTESLARWMIPTFWIVVNELPTNSSGKLDRNKARSFVENLTEDDFEQASHHISDSHFEAPQTSMELFLQSLWSSILKIPLDQISATASFLRLGGDSITAMKAVSKCRTEGVAISVHDILVCKSLSELAHLADPSSTPMYSTDRLGHGDVADTSVQNESPQETAISDDLYDTILDQASVKAGNVEKAVLASDYQVSALEQTLLDFRGDLTYHTFEIPKPVNFTRLALSCVELVNCHPLLRSVFVSHKRKVYQVTLKSSFVDLVDRTDQPELAKLIEDDGKIKLRLGQPMVWFKLIRGGPSDECDSLVIRVPHCLYDASTLASLVSDLEQAYFSTNALEQPVKSSEYTAYRKQSYQKALTYWSQYLEGSTADQIVTKSRPPFRHGKQRTLSSNFHMGSLKSHGITSATIVKAAWGFILTQLHGKDDVVFGELVSGRCMAVSGIDSLDVVCASTAPLRVKLKSSWTVIELLKSVQERQLASMPFEFVGDSSIVKECTSWPEWTRFGSVVNHIPLPATNYTAGKAFKPTGIHGKLNPSSDLNIQCHPLHVTSDLDANFQVEMTFDENSIPPVFAREILDRFCRTIRKFTSDLTSSLANLREGPIDSWPLPDGCENTSKSVDLSVSIKPTEKDERLSKVVQSVWKSVIGQSDELDTPFFAHWEALIAAAHFVVAYEQFGFKFTMEDILESPTMQNQIHLCARQSDSAAFGCIV
ncbi:hypothetical protein N7466_005827 [Penicillium verhagenii]|uniref:uncharacterized protein n=1 Tax=Penicillium verhagenii TaxID=1562060 RepID=UPI0025450836|nr:uncharacterized protein N7466_005827 [Penicillium verhagenii]KAJ5930334.1 hypothetical protein N7466_005827 [Penicillium verhagenii]